MARYIDADALIVAIQEGYKFGSLTITELISKQPTSDVVERKRGEWTEEGYCPFCKCDMPAFIVDWDWKRCRTPYCPNCGARMDERREDEI